MELRELGCVPGDWIDFADDRDQCKGGIKPPGSLKANQCSLTQARGTRGQMKKSCTCHRFDEIGLTMDNESSLITVLWRMHSFSFNVIY